MPEHYTRNTTAVLRYCPTCNKNTMHSVYNKRIGSCMNSHVKEPDKKKQTSNNQESLLL